MLKSCWTSQRLWLLAIAQLVICLLMRDFLILAELNWLMGVGLIVWEYHTRNRLARAIARFQELV